MKDKIIKYITEKYKPHTFFICGSYADDTYTQASDFDATIITDEIIPKTSDETFRGISLDLHIYRTAEAENIEPEKLLPIYNGKLIADRNGVGRKILIKVENYIKNYPAKSAEEKAVLANWCIKMIGRSSKENIDGFYRWHNLLSDSLEIYFIMRDSFYFGPKKSIKIIEETDKIGFQLMSAAMEYKSTDKLSSWIYYLLNSKQQ